MPPQMGNQMQRNLVMKWKLGLRMGLYSEFRMAIGTEQEWKTQWKLMGCRAPGRDGGMEKTRKLL